MGTNHRGAMNLGIVGHAQEKFTPETEALAREAIVQATLDFGASQIVSGHSPMGGVDWYAEAIAAELRLPTIIHEPTINQWASAKGKIGFRERNLAIARDSDLVLVVVVKTLPPDFKGMRFSGCYHCGTRNPDHVKSGGCWTAWKCKAHEWRII